MPIIIHCPSCSRQLRVPDDLLGRMVKCPSCNTTFTAERPADLPTTPPGSEGAQPGGASGPVSDYRLEEEPARPRPRVTPRDDYDEEGPDEEYEERPRPRRRSRERALSAVKAPAICLLVTGILAFLLDIYNVVAALTRKPPDMQMPAGADPRVAEFFKNMQEWATGPAAMAMAVVFALIALIVILGAVMMLAGKARGLGIAASILAMLHLGSCCCILGIPFGIWSLVVLTKPEVSDAFQ